MAGTRSSPRLSRTQKNEERTETNDKKRKAEDQDSPAKPAKKQQTLEQNGIHADKPQDQVNDQDMKDVAAEADADDKANGPTNGTSNGASNGTFVDTSNGTSHNDQKAVSNGNDKSASKDESNAKSETGNGNNPNGATNGNSNETSNEEPDVKSETTNGNTAEKADAKPPTEPEQAQAQKKDESSHNGTQQSQTKNDDGQKDETATDDQSSSKDDSSAVQKDQSRADQMPSNILERGVIYFFSRGRVGVDNMESVQDIQRSFFVLRPLPAGTKLTSGALTDSDLKPSTSNRLFALPKKVWPKSGADKFMAFVEKAPTSLSDLKTNFFQGSSYTTQTAGVRSQPPVTPVGEGVYAITTSGGNASGSSSTTSAAETHLSYMLTIPREPGELQSDIGLRSKASFVLSLKNPESKGPANAQLANPAEFPREIMDEFRGRSWMPVRPEHMDYAGCQVLMIGVGDVDGSAALTATEAEKGDEEKETPGEELEKLEEEDEVRVRGLKGDDAVFSDLGLERDEYPDVATTW